MGGGDCAKLWEKIRAKERKERNFGRGEGERKSKVKTLSLPVCYAWQSPPLPLLLFLLPPQEIAISANLERNFTEILAGDIERALINDSMSL